MARGTGLFGVALSALARGQRQAISALARAQRQSAADRRRQVREQQRLARQALVRLRQETAEQKKLYLKNRLREVEESNIELAMRMGELRAVLDASLRIRAENLFDALRKENQHPFNPPAKLTASSPAPVRVTVPEPYWLFRFFEGTMQRYRRSLAEADARYRADMQRYRDAETQRNKELTRLRAEHDRAVAEKMSRIDELEQAYKSGEQSAVVEYNTLILERSKYPEGFPQQFRVAFVPESRQLVVDYQLPAPAIVPEVSEFRYIKSKDEIEEKPCKAGESKQSYQEVVAGTTLRTVYEILSRDRGNHINVVVFNGYVHTVDPATGKDIRPYLISVRVTKDRFAQLDLARVEKRTCLRNLGAQISPQPSELLPVRPIIEFDMVDKRFVEDGTVLEGLDPRVNLMDLNWHEFEILTTDLFAKMGLEAKHTQSSRDGGVNAVAWDARPVLGGKVVVQAKRYRNTVGVSAVRDLYGTMINEGANKGILITTSGYGPDAYEFAKDKPIELIDGGGLLYLLEQVGAKARIVFPLEEPDHPPGTA